MRTLILAAMLMVAVAARAQPVTIIVPIERNGIIDAIARPLAAAMGTQVIVDNKPGGLTNLGSAYVAHAPGDGMTLLANSRQMVNNVFVSKDMPFNPVKDLIPVSLVATTSFVLAVRPDLPAKTVAELIALAKLKPGGLSYANSGKASNQQMSMELFKSMSGTDITRHEYDGGGGAMDGVAAGTSDMGFFALVAVSPLLKTGKLRPVAVTGATRSSLLSDLPTVAESGLPGYEFTSWVGIFAPASTPAPIISALSSQVAAAAKSSAFGAQMRAQGGEAVGSSQPEFAAFFKSELSLWGGIIEKSGLSRE